MLICLRGACLHIKKIYQDFYRDSQWESSRPSLFNLNYMDGSSGNEQIQTDEIDYTKWTMFDLRYANWQKDYFMGLLPNSQYGDAAVVDLSNGGSVNLSIEFDDPSDATGVGYVTMNADNNNMH